MGTFCALTIKKLKKELCELAVTIELHQCDLCDLYDQQWKLGVEAIQSSSVCDKNIEEFFTIRGSIAKQKLIITQLNNLRTTVKHHLNFHEDVMAISQRG